MSDQTMQVPARAVRGDVTSLQHSLIKAREEFARVARGDELPAVREHLDEAVIATDTLASTAEQQETIPFQTVEQQARTAHRALRKVLDEFNQSGRESAMPNVRIYLGEAWTAADHLMTSTRELQPSSR